MLNKFNCFVPNLPFACFRPEYLTLNFCSMCVKCIVFFFFLAMTNPYLQESSTSSMFMNTRSSVLIVIDTTRQPTDLQDGISKLISYAPHGNLVDENAMNEEMSEFRWHVE